MFAAARAAQCEEFIGRLEHGWDTAAGDAGKQLSGGERQRIAIARAILKDAPIVILDEATAFTDPENEDKIQRVHHGPLKGKTLLVIAHRLSTIQNADQIVVLEKGQIVDRGTQRGAAGSLSAVSDVVGGSCWGTELGRDIGVKRRETEMFQSVGRILRVGEGLPETHDSGLCLLLLRHLVYRRAGDAGRLGLGPADRGTPRGKRNLRFAPLAVPGRDHGTDFAAVPLHLLEEPAPGEHRHGAGGRPAHGTGDMLKRVSLGYFARNNLGTS